MKSTSDIILGMSASFEGASRGLGIELYRGAQAYFNYINDRGGIQSRKISIIAQNDSYNPALTLKNTMNFIEDEDIFALFGYVGTPTTVRILPILKYRPFYLLFPFTGAQPHREYPFSQYVFNLRASYREETEELINFFYKNQIYRIGVFFQNDDYGRSGWDGVRRALGKYDLNIVSTSSYIRGTAFNATFDENLKEIMVNEPDAIVCVGAYEACAGFIYTARKLGVGIPIANISFVGSESLLSLLIDKSMNDNIDYTVNLVNTQVVPSYENTQLDVVNEYRELLEFYDPQIPSKFSSSSYKSPQYCHVSLEGFINAKLFVEVIHKMDIIDSKNIPNAIENLANCNLGLDTPARFSPNDHQGFHTVYFTHAESGHFIEFGT